MEPIWTKQVPSWLVCDWFYAFFLLNLGVAIVLALSLVYLMFSSGVPKVLRPYTIFIVFMKLIVSATSTLFFYLLCDRSLKPTQ